MELRHLRYFVAVAEELNFTRAAQRLLMAQPPLTRLIHDLEKEIGVELFDRRERQIALTTAGAAFLERVYPILAQCDEAVQVAQHVSRGKLGRLKVGFRGAAIYTVLPESVSVYAERAPKVEVTLSEFGTQEQIQALRDERLDLGFVMSTKPEPGLEYETIFSCPVVVALPEKHPLAHRAVISVVDLADEAWIACPGNVNPRTDEQSWRLFQQAGFEPHLIQGANLCHVTLNLIAAGLGIALVGSWVKCMQQPGVVYRPLHEASWLTSLQMVWRKDETSPLTHAFIEVVREVGANFTLRNTLAVT